MTPDGPAAGATPATVRHWTLTKAGRTATGDAAAHALGVEFVVTVAGDVQRTQVVRTLAEGETVAAAWRQAFEGKGWRA